MITPLPGLDVVLVIEAGLVLIGRWADAVTQKVTRRQRRRLHSVLCQCLAVSSQALTSGTFLDVWGHGIIVIWI